MRAQKVPTAAASTFSDSEEALRYCERLKFPVVIKAEPCSKTVWSVGPLPGVPLMDWLAPLLNEANAPAHLDWLAASGMAGSDVA